MPSSPFSTRPLDQHHVVPSEQLIDVDAARLEATLTVPPAAQGLIALLHASSAGRFAPMSRFTAQVFEQAGLATLQVDLLTPEEEAQDSPRSRRHLLEARVVGVIDWLRQQPDTSVLSLGLFASSRELAAALGAAERRSSIAAIASAGELLESADEPFGSPSIPTLLLVKPDEQARAAELSLEFFNRHLRGQR